MICASYYRFQLDETKELEYTYEKGTVPELLVSGLFLTLYDKVADINILDRKDGNRE